LDLGEGHVIADGRTCRAPRGNLALRGSGGEEKLRADLGARAEHGRALERVAQLADVARPGMGEERFERRGSQLEARPAVLSPEASEQLLGEAGQVLPALPERGQLEGEDVQAVEEVLAKAPGGDLGFEVLVGRGE